MVENFTNMTCRNDICDQSRDGRTWPRTEFYFTNSYFWRKDNRGGAVVVGFPFWIWCSHNLIKSDTEFSRRLILRFTLIIFEQVDYVCRFGSIREEAWFPREGVWDGSCDEDSHWHWRVRKGNLTPIREGDGKRMWSNRECPKTTNGGEKGDGGGWEETSFSTQSTRCTHANEDEFMNVYAKKTCVRNYWFSDRGFVSVHSSMFDVDISVFAT